MKRKYCWTIAVFTIICCVVFFVNMSFAGTESTETQTLRDALRDDTTAVTIEMGVLRDLQNEMWRLKSSWDSCQRELRELGINKLNDMAQLDVVNTIVRMWNTPEQTTRQIDYGISLNSYMQEAIDMVHTQLVHTDCAVALYNTAWAALSGAVSMHNYSHISQSEPNHSTPKFVADWKYLRSFPEFPCAGDCNQSFSTPVSPHAKVCGVNDNTEVAGCGKKYFSCKQKENDKHKVRTCNKWVNTFTPGKIMPTFEERCKRKFRHCTNPKFEHNTHGTGWRNKHSEKGKPNTVPSRPGSFSLTPGCISIQLRWNSSPFNGGSAITAYEFQYQSSTNGRRTWSSWSEWESGGTDNFHLIQELSPDTDYAVRMRARNEVGPSNKTGIKIIRTLAKKRSRSPTRKRR